LEDACLMLLVHLAAYDECINSIRGIKNAAMALSRLKGQGGIHALRASALLARLSGGRAEEKKESHTIDNSKSRSRDFVQV
jgi:hypothetical protein